MPSRVYVGAAGPDSQLGPRVADVLTRSWLEVVDRDAGVAFFALDAPPMSDGGYLDRSIVTGDTEYVAAMTPILRDHHVVAIFDIAQQTVLAFDPLGCTLPSVQTLSVMGPSYVDQAQEAIDGLVRAFTHWLRHVVGVWRADGSQQADMAWRAVPHTCAGGAPGVHTSLACLEMLEAWHAHVRHPRAGGFVFHIRSRQPVSHAHEGAV